jgi:hypothetical protein
LEAREGRKKFKLVDAVTATHVAHEWLTGEGLTLGEIDKALSNE